MVNCVLQRGAPGYMVVTLLLFSGREDPGIVVNLSLLDPVDNQLVQSLGIDPKCAPPKFGYKGFTLKVAGGRKALLVGRDGDRVRLQYKLLDMMPNSMVPSHLRQLVLNEIGNVSAQCPSPAESLNFTPPYEPHKWNGNINTICNNNCYNYANDIQKDNYAQPGRGSGRIFKEYTGAEVLNAAKRDGLKVLDPHPKDDDRVPAAPDGPRHLVALFIWPCEDFHWYRLDADGYWSHKRGRTRVAGLDDSGRLIKDPRKADTGDYVEFVAFMTTDKDKVTIK